MKDILKIFLGAAAAVLLVSSCSKSQNILYENDVDSKVYFPVAERNPLITVSQEDLDENGCYQLCIYNAGNNSGSIQADIVVDEYALDVYNIEAGTDYEQMPADYWSLLQSTVTLDTGENNQVYVPVKLDIAGFKAAGLSADDYILPLSLQAESTLNVSFDYKSVYIKFE